MVDKSLMEEMLPKPYIEKEIDEITVDKPKKGMCPDAWLKKNMFVIRFK